MTIPENPRPSEDYPDESAGGTTKHGSEETGERWAVEATDPRPTGAGPGETPEAGAAHARPADAEATAVGAAAPDPAPPTGRPSRGTGEAAKEETQQLAQDAKGGVQQVADDARRSGQQVTQTAKEEAQHVAETVSEHVRTLAGQATSELSGQAGTQQQRLAEGLRSLAGQFGAMADSSDDSSSQATGLVREASQRAEGVASWLEHREPGDVVEEVRRFARRRPGAFIAIAAGVGLLAGRLTRNLASGGDETDATATDPAAAQGGPYVAPAPAPGTPVPPPPVAAPGPVAPVPDTPVAAAGPVAPAPVVPPEAPGDIDPEGPRAPGTDTR